jgi:hypothetical protein
MAMPIIPWIGGKRRLADELINLSRMVQHYLKEFVRQFWWALSSRSVHHYWSEQNCVMYRTHCLQLGQNERPSGAVLKQEMTPAWSSPVRVSGFNEERAYAAASAFDEQCRTRFV